MKARCGRSRRAPAEIREPPGGALSPRPPSLLQGHWKLPRKSWDQGPNSRGQHPLRRQCSTRNLVHNERTCRPPSALRRSPCRDSTAGRRERASQLCGVGLALHLGTESDRDLGHDPALRVGHRASVPEGSAEQMTTTRPDLRGRARRQSLDVDVSPAPGLDVDASAGQAPAGSAARLRRLVDLRLRSAHAGGVLGDLAAPVSILSFAGPAWYHTSSVGQVHQQLALLERAVVLHLHGHPPVGEVLDGRLARPSSADLDDRRGVLPGLARHRLHRLPGADQLRLAVDLVRGQGRAERGRYRRLLQCREPGTDASDPCMPAALGRRSRGGLARAPGSPPRRCAPDRRCRRDRPAQDVAETKVVS